MDAALRPESSAERGSYYRSRHDARDAVSGEKMSHPETGAGWDVVAREKYRAEFDDHVALLRSGSDNLLPEERELLSPLLAGAHVIHLQCSHGLDALGLLNAGAESVLGLDISPEMVAQARAKAEAVGSSRARFLVADASAPPGELMATANLIYTGRGALPWIQNLDRWAAAAAALLEPRGHLFIFEGHPLTDLWDREASDLRLRDGASYFDDDPREAPGFPADVVERALGPDRPAMRERHWRLGEIIEAVLQAGFRLHKLREFPALYWDQFPSWSDELRSHIPNSYALLAQLP